VSVVDRSAWKTASPGPEMLLAIEDRLSGFVRRTTSLPEVIERTGSPFAWENVRAYSVC
jgi:hypothetical protein